MHVVSDKVINLSGHGKLQNDIVVAINEHGRQRKNIFCWAASDAI